MEIERYDELNKRTASVPFTKLRFYTKLLASPIAMTSIDDFPLIRPNRLPESIRLNVRDQLAILFVAHLGEDVGYRVKLHAIVLRVCGFPPCRQKEGLAATEETASPYPAAEAGKLCSRLSRYALSRPPDNDLERFALIQH